MDAFNTCPRRFYETKIAQNFKEELGEAVRWGNEVHKAMELRVGEAVPLPSSMVQWEPMAAAFVAAKGEKYCELKLAVDANLSPCDFFDEDCWNRGVEDLLIINGRKAVSIDHKTGKKKPSSQQLKLSACRVFAKFPEVREVETAFNWMLTGEWTRAVYKREQLSEMWESYFDGVRSMLWAEEHNAWPAKPSGLCRKYCPVTSCPSNGQYRRRK